MRHERIRIGPASRMFKHGDIHFDKTPLVQKITRRLPEFTTADEPVAHILIDVHVNAELIKAGKGSKVSLGSKVELKTGKKTVNYTVVGPVEADPLEGKISNESPIGVALMGKKVGDTVTITTPKGEVTYEIVSIS